MSSNSSSSGIQSSSQLLNEDFDSSSSGIGSEERINTDGSTPLDISVDSGFSAPRSATPLSQTESLPSACRNGSEVTDYFDGQRRVTRKVPQPVANNVEKSQTRISVPQTKELGRDIIPQAHKVAGMLRQMNHVFRKRKNIPPDNSQLQDVTLTQINSRLSADRTLRSRSSKDPENRSLSRDGEDEMDVDASVSSESSWEIIPRKLTGSELVELNYVIKRRRVIEVVVPNYLHDRGVRLCGKFVAKDIDTFARLMAEIDGGTKRNYISAKVTPVSIAPYLRSKPADLKPIKDLFFSALKTHRQNSSNIVLICVLMANGINCDESNELGESPVKLAIDSEDPSLIDLMLASTQKVSIDLQKNSALHLAAIAWKANAEKWDLVSLIAMFKLHCDPFGKNITGRTPLTTFLSSPDFKFHHLEELIRSYGVIRLKTSKTRLAHLLAAAGRIDLLYFALSRFPIDINEQDNQQRTVFHILAGKAGWSKHDVEVVAELVQTHNADMTIVSKTGSTAVEIADMRGNSVLKTYLDLASRGEFRYDDNVLIKDVSYGCEPFPIKVIRPKAGSAIQTLEKFVYVRQNIYLGDCPTTKSLMRCTCLPGTCSLGGCICLERGLGYSARGTVIPGTCKANPIFECGPTCGCGPDCASRVVQRGIRMPFEIFLTGNRGWGVRALRTIEPGEYIMEFAGEIVETEKLLIRDENNDWAMELTVDNYAGTTYHVDPTKVGNVARFLNHSCDPNLFPVRVYQSGQPADTGVRMAMFSAQRIPKNRELTFYYGESYWERVHAKGIRCQCSTSKCKWGPGKKGKRGAKK